MKKLLIILLTLTFATAAFVGCSKSDTNPPTNNGSNEDTDNNVTITPTTPADNDTSESNVTVDEIYEAIKAAYGENYLPNMEITPEFLEAEFGLTSDMYEEVKAEMPMISVNADRVVVVKAAEGRADDVEAALNTAKENKINDTMQYPMNLPKINAAQVVRNGDFVCFLLVGAIDERENPTEAEAEQFAKDEVAKAVNAVNELFK